MKKTLKTLNEAEARAYIISPMGHGDDGKKRRRDRDWKKGRRRPVKRTAVRLVTGEWKCVADLASDGSDHGLWPLLKQCEWHRYDPAYGISKRHWLRLRAEHFKKTARAAFRGRMAERECDELPDVVPVTVLKVSSKVEVKAGRFYPASAEDVAALAMFRP